MTIDAFMGECGMRAERGEAFVFFIDYEMEHFDLYSFEEAKRAGVLFRINKQQNYEEMEMDGRDFEFKKKPMDFVKYKLAFDKVRAHIRRGNSFLLNLTFPTALQSNLSLEEIFYRSKAPYKCWFRDRFVVFSPETFVKMEGAYIYTYPMKGTIDALEEDAERKLRENEKERREHNTIVDLLRNDLSMVAKDVEVTNFRYIDRLKTHEGELLQMSSEIRGRLPGNWKSELGNLLLRMLPAGSICGAPKKKTREIIAEAEDMKRGYFTGVMGVFDGEVLDSGVMIRFIEVEDDAMRFRSGGGITGHSKPEEEYKEMIQKVYVPII